MQKKIILLTLCLACAGLCACSTKNENTSAMQTESVTTTGNEQASKPTESAQSYETETALPEQTEAAQPDKTEAVSIGQNESGSEVLTEEQALAAVRNYCFINNPDLKKMAESDEYTIYWDVSTNDNNEIVVLYRAYTGAQIRYYIDPVSGEAYVTELVPGIIDEEQRTEESFNVRDYSA